MKKSALFLLFVLCQLILAACLQDVLGQQGSHPSLKTVPYDQPGAFPLVRNNTVTAIYVEKTDAEVIRIAAEALAADLQLVSGMKPAVISTQNGQNDFLIIAGTIGQSPVIDALIQSDKLKVSNIIGKWESFSITTIDAPEAGVKQALVVAGSDARGTAYGLFEISRAAGISPWVWWADVPPAKQNILSILPGMFTSREPSVKYRGIFLNDEDWGLQPWAAKTFEPETGDIGPKTYARIFELLLRLRANLIWPAMHPGTRAFFTVPGNAKVAEDYAIIIGSSHAEPMLRNNVGEWNEKTMGAFNYISNKETVYKYWEDRVKESKGINAMYSMGMRGVHDSKMEGIKDAKEAVPLLENIIQEQREMLERNLSKNIKQIPQVFTAYKEVLEIYDNGLKLPDDITLVWPDDNYGYIQRLNNEAEKKRPGGSGIYYHASYWGRPHDYLWLSTTHPALVQEEMMKAFYNGSNKLWVLNAGDIKPLEYNIELFMDMAWDATPFWDNGYAKQHLLAWATKIFGKEKAQAIQTIMWEYYQLAFERRPEFMGWSQTEPTTKTNYTAFNHFFYGDEAQKRMDRYEALENEVKALYAQFQANDEAAFYQLVYYPVRGASLMNKKFLYRDKSYFYAKQFRFSSLEYWLKSQAAHDSIIAITNYYNLHLSGGKWNHMMSMQPRDLPVFHAPEWTQVKAVASEVWNVAPEGWVTKDSSLMRNTANLSLPGFDNKNRQQYFLDVFITENESVEWVASTSAPWIKLSKTSGKLSTDAGKSEIRVFITIDWSKAPKQEKFTGEIQIEGSGKKIIVDVSGTNLFLPPNYKGFIENNGYVAIQASHFNNQKQQAQGNWILLPGLGYSADAILAQVATGENSGLLKDTGWIKNNCSYAVYDFYTFKTANTALTVFSLPTHPLNNQFSMRYALSVDDGPLQLVDFKTVGRSEEWKQNVLRNRAERKLQLSVLEKGAHSLKMYCVDPGVVLQDFVIDLGGVKHAYSAVPEAKIITGKTISH